MITSVDPEKCTGCGTCVKNCTLDVFALDTAQAMQAPCMPACPCGVDIRGMLYLLQQDKKEAALDLLKRAVPFPAITCRLCAHPCEDSCVRTPSEKSVNILGLERYLADFDLEMREERQSPRHLAEVAVVGGGLAGLSCACFLSRQGYPVTVFERGSELGGSLNALPEAEMPRALLRRQWDKITELGIAVRLNCAIGPRGDLDWPELFRRGYKTCCLATGDPEPGRRPLGLCETDPDGLVKADVVTRQTADQRIFAAGAVCGSRTVEEAMGQARTAARSIAHFLQGEDLLVDQNRVARGVAPSPPVLPTFRGFKSQRRKNGSGWEQTLRLEEVQREALRCLTCGSKAFLAHTDDCMTCFTCEIGCPSSAITVHPFKEILPRSLELLD